MDIAAMAMGMKQMELQTQVSVSVLKNVKEMAEVQGEAISEMIESVPHPEGIGQHIDISL